MTPLERYVEFMQSVASFELDSLSNFIAADVHFVDPFNDTRGLAHYTRIIEDMRHQLDGLKIDVLDSVMVAEHRGLIRWQLSGKLKAFKQRHWSVEGCSMVRFNETGQLIEHIDYWDAAGQLYESFPLIGKVLQKLRKKLAVR